MNDNEKIEFTQDILQYIDSHIKQKLNVEKLAAKAGFSPYYFCRGFKWEVGVSIMEYVRNRRLAYAASELHKGRTILDIAIDYGFETHSGFSKAFRRYFGCPPEVYRAYATFNVPPLPDLVKARQYISVNMLEPKILAKKAAFKIAGYPIHIDHENKASFEQISLLREEYRNDGRLKRLHSEPFVRNHMEYGACLYYKYIDNSESIYVIAVEVKPRQKIPFDYHVYTIPEAVFAVFAVDANINDDFLSAIGDTWQMIFSEWLPNSGYEFNSKSFAFELYNEYRTSDMGKVCDIYVPIINRDL